MNGVLLRGCAPFRKALTANTTESSFDSKVPTTTEPTGSDVFDIQFSPDQRVHQGVQAIFYGAGSNNQTLTARLIGWKLYGDLWIPAVLAEIACTLSDTAVGVSGASIADTELFADTLVLASGFSTDNVKLTSPASDIVGHATINLDGYGKIEWSLKVGTATNANALFALY